MLAEIIIENDEVRVINLPKGLFKGRHWKVNIEPIEEIIDNDTDGDFIAYITRNPVKIESQIEFLSRDAANER